MQPKRVLFITPQPYFEWRGSPIRVSFNVMALTELGFEVDLLCLPFGLDRETPGMRCIRVHSIPGLESIPIGPSIWKIPFDIKLWLKARRLISERNYDVIHAVEDAGFLAISLARRSGARLVFEKHSDPASYKGGWFRNAVMRAYALVEERSIRAADAVICTGPALAQQARKVAPSLPVHHISDIASSLVMPDDKRTAEIRRQLLRTPSDVIITYVGSFAIYQGIDLLFSCIPDVASRYPQARFVIIGGTPEEIIARRNQLGACRERVEFLGKKPPDELPDYLAASDILLSSRIAGANTPLKLLDYLKAGRSIVATDNEANRLILTEDTALFTNPHPDAFGDGIGRLIENPRQRLELGRNGKCLAEKEYSYQKFKISLANVYQFKAHQHSA